jgi:hypothetical protein
VIAIILALLALELTGLWLSVLLGASPAAGLPTDFEHQSFYAISSFSQYLSIKDALAAMVWITAGRQNGRIARASCDSGQSPSSPMP